jgi:hypothetical protein
MPKKRDKRKKRKGQGNLPFSSADMAVFRLAAIEREQGRRVRPLSNIEAERVARDVEFNQKERDGKNG